MKKKRFSVLIALLTVVLSANAQFNEGTWSVQPKLGIGSSWLINQPDLPVEGNVPGVDIELKKDLYPMFMAGIEAEYQMTSQFSVAAGLNYSQQGGKWKNYAETLNGVLYEVKDTKLNLGYITLPVVANYYVMDGWAVKAGVQLGYLVHASMKSNSTASILGTTESNSYQMDESIIDDCNRLEFSIPVGVSYQFSTNWYLEGRYNISITRLNKEKDDDGDMRNGLLLLSLGYKFEL